MFDTAQLHSTSPARVYSRVMTGIRGKRRSVGTTMYCTRTVSCDTVTLSTVTISQITARGDGGNHNTEKNDGWAVSISWSEFLLVCYMRGTYDPSTEGLIPDET